MKGQRPWSYCNNLVALEEAATEAESEENMIVETGERRTPVTWWPKVERHS